MRARLHRQIPSAPKLSQIVYDKPIKNDVAVLLPYFNYCGSTRVVQNALFVKHMLDNASIPYYIGEVAFNDSSFLFSNALSSLGLSPSVFIFSIVS